MLGICCHYLREEVKPKTGRKFYVNDMEERVLQLGRYRSGKYMPEAIKATYVNNVRRLAEMLPKIHATGVRLFRMSSNLLPLADQVPRELWDNGDVRRHLVAAGTFAQTHGMRITSHPGQFCVLSSDSDKVVENAFKELDIHAWLFDAMGFDLTPKWAINIHGGKANRSSRLIDQIKSLPDGVRKRLTLENDENCYNVIDLLEVYQATGVPITWDSHHHTFNDGGLSMEDAYAATAETWPNGIAPLQHLSNTEPSLANGSFTDRRKHSDMVHYVPDCQLRGLRDRTIDVELEAKMKNVALFKAAADFDIPLA